MSRKAGRMSSRRSWRTASLRLRCTHEIVRSTTQRYLPRRSLLYIPFLAILTLIPSLLRALLHLLES
jgi:hypothetical protein